MILNYQHLHLATGQRALETSRKLLASGKTLSLKTPKRNFILALPEHAMHIRYHTKSPDRPMELMLPSPEALPMVEQERTALQKYKINIEKEEGIFTAVSSNPRLTVLLPFDSITAELCDQPLCIIEHEEPTEYVLHTDEELQIKDTVRIVDGDEYIIEPAVIKEKGNIPTGTNIMGTYLKAQVTDKGIVDIGPCPNIHHNISPPCITTAYYPACKHKSRIQAIIDGVDAPHILIIDEEIAIYKKQRKLAQVRRYPCTDLTYPWLSRLGFLPKRYKGPQGKEELEFRREQLKTAPLTNSTRFYFNLSSRIDINTYPDRSIDIQDYATEANGLWHRLIEELLSKSEEPPLAVGRYVLHKQIHPVLRKNNVRINKIIDPELLGLTY
ncbi:hypothetical protein H6504_04445 [Candidatus Woesearchaeota archaeon]|nr:hypothetical protein [Candidatus Woesearchaeota archaeon]